MNISKVHIENFKIFKGEFDLPLNRGVNILVGNNESGKSTIIEAIHLALTGLYNGKYLKNELTEYLFNKEICDEYIRSLKTPKAISPPYILIEIYISGDSIDENLWGDNNEAKMLDQRGFSLKIEFDEKYKDEYEALIKTGEVKTLPIEYYDVQWTSFAREAITPKTIPIKSALIDSSSNKFQNGSDIYILRIIKDNLEKEDVVKISQAHRQMKENFIDNETIKTINDRIKTAAKISDKKIELSVELSSKNAWESSLITCVEDIPFHFIGKGEQCLIKTKLALGYKQVKKANIILFEEPENHLSHTKLNQLIRNISNENSEKQILISTHNSFVANKLGLENLIFLNSQKTVRLNELSNDTFQFFKKLSGYDTLRLLLCEKAILVEGDSDELVVQKAFMLKNDGELPIEKGIDVISVGTSFLRFLEIAEKIKKQVVVVTDNDGDINALKKKYANYLSNNTKDFIKICFDETLDDGKLEIDGKKFNYNTLEPKILKVNGRDKINTILETSYQNDDDLHKYMKANKTECALKIFDTTEDLTFPQYILDAIVCNEQQ
jgi:putative ATP-dependent endonuclease of OLD family